MSETQDGGDDILGPADHPLSEPLVLFPTGPPRMTLKQYYATAAMHALLADDPDRRFQDIALEAFAMAAHMLKHEKGSE